MKKYQLWNFSGHMATILVEANRITKIIIHITCFNSFSFICLPMLCNILRKWIIRVWSTQKSLDADTVNNATLK